MTDALTIILMVLFLALVLISASLGFFISDQTKDRERSEEFLLFWPMVIPRMFQKRHYTLRGKKLVNCNQLIAGLLFLILFARTLLYFLHPS